MTNTYHFLGEKINVRYEYGFYEYEGLRYLSHEKAVYPIAERTHEVFHIETDTSKSFVINERLMIEGNIATISDIVYDVSNGIYLCYTDRILSRTVDEESETKAHRLKSEERLARKMQEQEYINKRQEQEEKDETWKWIKWFK